MIISGLGCMLTLIILLDINGLIVMKALKSKN